MSANLQTDKKDFPQDKNRGSISAPLNATCLNCEHRRELQKIKREAQTLVNRLQDLIDRTAGQES